MTVTFLVCANTVHRRPLVIISLQVSFVNTRQKEVKKKEIRKLNTDWPVYQDVSFYSSTELIHWNSVIIFSL